MLTLMNPANLFDTFCDDFFRPVFRAEPMMKVDVREEEGKYLLMADLPGVEKDNVHIEVKDGIITIETRFDEETKNAQEGRFLCRERRSGEMRRSFSLEGIDENGISANFRNGVLTLELPKAAPAALPEARAIAISD